MNSLLITNLMLPLLALLGMMPLLFYDLYRIQSVRSAVSRNEKRLRQKKKQTEVLHHLLEKSIVQESQEIRINQLMDDLEDNLGWKMISYWAFLEGEQVIEMRNSRGLPKKFTDFTKQYYHNRLEVGSVAGGRAISTKQPVVSNNWNADPQLRHLPFLSEYGHIGSFAAFPVVSNQKTYGSFHVYGTKINAFTLNEVQFFTTITNSFAAILDHSEFSTKGGDRNGNDNRKS